MCAFIGLLLLPSLGEAAEVQVVALTPGRSASMVIDGAAPMTVGVGETVEGVTLVRVDSDSAVVRIHGMEQALMLEAYEPPSIGVAGGSSVRLSADPSGHFITNGAVNGRSVRFLVDTGASVMTLSRKQAKRIGLRYKNGAPGRASTANGIVNGWLVSLDTVRIGTVTERNVRAMVIDGDLGVGLLGMSFLDRFDMERQGSKLVLRRRR
jgi:aspartyl protease family protein